MPEWFIKDILIDLQNQVACWEGSRNRIILESEYQKELNDSQSLLYYPLLDRFSSNYYEGIIAEAIKYKIQSPGTITYGHGLGSHIKALASIYVLAMYNGSLTQLQLLYERIKYIAFYCASRYSNWGMKKLLLKTAIIGRNQKEIDGIIGCFGELLRMNENEANEIYSFANSVPIAHHRFISKLEAFRVTSYNMDDESFTCTWAELYEYISKWIEDKNSVAAVGWHIFPALEGSYLRIPQDQLIEIICKCIQYNKRRFQNEIFKLIRKGVDFEQAPTENTAILLEVIINIVRSPDERKNIHTLSATLYTIRKKNRELTEELDRVIAEEMPDFYNDTYRLETAIDENEDIPRFLEKFISQVRSDNEKQGKNGCFFGRGNQPHSTIKNILQLSDAEFSEDLINSAFKATCETLLTDTQTIEAKMDAIELLMYLLKAHPGTKEHNKGEIEMLLSNKARIEKAQSVMTNLDETILRFSALLLYSCLGESIIVGMLGVLADIGDDISSNQKASEAILSYLEADQYPIPDIQLEHMFLQQAIEWSVDARVDIRWNAVLILFSLLRNDENINVICNQLVMLMDNDNVHIKNRILRSVHQIKDIDIETYKYILQKAAVDSNYVVRKVAGEVTIEN